MSPSPGRAPRGADGSVEAGVHGSAQAAVLLGAAVFGLAVAGARAPEQPARPCLHPSEAQAEGGWTTLVHCGDAPGGPPLVGPARLLFGLSLDVNRADARALESLPGIGPGRAASIVDARVRRTFASLADLERVRGIGPRTVEGLAGWAHAAPRGAGVGMAAGGRAGGEPRHGVGDR